MYQLNSNISVEETKALVEAHSYLQRGCYFTDIEDCASGKLCTSQWIDDYFWNLLSSFSESNGSKLLEESIPCFKRKERQPAFYIDPSCMHSDLINFLKSKSFSLEKEIWMSPKGKLHPTNIHELSINPVIISNSDEFLRVFSVAFGGESTESDGYGDIPPSYLNALKDSISGKSAPGVEHLHFVGLYDNKVVSCGSIHISNNYAGLYNIGVIPDYRKLGIGAALSHYAMKIAQKRNVARIFFQTQPGGTVQSFYEGLGCEVIFETAIAFME